MRADEPMHRSVFICTSFRFTQAFPPTAGLAIIVGINSGPQPKKRLIRIGTVSFVLLQFRMLSGPNSDHTPRKLEKAWVHCQTAWVSVRMFLRPQHGMGLNVHSPMLSPSSASEEEMQLKSTFFAPAAGYHNHRLLSMISSNHASSLRASAIETDVTVTESDSAGDWLTDFYVPAYHEWK